MFKKINENATIPEAKTIYSAGFDVSALEDTQIKPNEIALVKTGIALDLDENKFKDYFLGLYARSSLCKEKLILANGVGIVDIDYKGEIKVPLLNVGNETVTVAKGQRVAQLILQTHKGIGVGERKEDKRTGGFGSTDTIKLKIKKKLTDFSKITAGCKK